MKQKGIAAPFLIVLVLIGAVIVFFLKREYTPGRLQSRPTPYPSRAATPGTPSPGTVYCGGLAGIPCPASGYTCVPEGNFPDAQTVCTPIPQGRSGGCIAGGCSGELCSDEQSGGMVSPCIFKPEYACYKTAMCQRQPDGKCGWTRTPELEKCLEDAK